MVMVSKEKIWVCVEPEEKKKSNSKQFYCTLQKLTAVLQTSTRGSSEPVCRVVLTSSAAFRALFLPHPQGG